LERGHPSFQKLYIHFRLNRQNPTILSLTEKLRKKREKKKGMRYSGRGEQRGEEGDEGRKNRTSVSHSLAVSTE